MIDKYVGFDTNKLKTIIRKVRTMYNNKKIKNILSSQLDIVELAYNNIVYHIDNFINYINQINEHKAEIIIDQLYLTQITKECIIRADILKDALIVNNTKFTDIYMLRRFLDKDFIINAVSYTGGRHSNYYVYILVKYFSFVITNFSYSTIADIDLLNDSIRKAENSTNLDIYLFSPGMIQCSNISNFPDNFQ
jgi:hypothetical protein